MIEADRLARRFGPVQAVDGVSFTAAPGEVVGLLGPNGAGKTTTLRIVAGVLAPDGGTARLGGIDIVARPTEARRRLGYLPEQLALPPELRVREYLEFRAGLRDIPRRERVRAIDELDPDPAATIGVDGGEGPPDCIDGTTVDGAHPWSNSLLQDRACPGATVAP